MKKLVFLFIVVMFVSTHLFAQSRVKIGPELGVTYMNMYQKLSNNVYTTTPQVGFRIGAVGDIALGESKFYIQPGLSLMFNNGTKSVFDDYYVTGAGYPTSTHDDREYHVLSINAPLYFVFKTGSYFDDPHFFVGLGVFANANVGGRFRQTYTTKLHGDDRNAQYDRAIYIGNQRTDDDIAIWDIGPTATIGYELPVGLLFRGYFNYGLFNQAPGNKQGDYFQNMGGGISIAWLLGTAPGQTWGWK